jgi:hypothetical protein
MRDLTDETELRGLVRRVVDTTPVLDIHTHLYPPRFGRLMAWGIDELLTYHYLAAEVLRAAPIPYDRFWAMTKRDQADYIWKHLFVDHSPVSEACRGVLTVLHALGLDVGKRDLAAIRSQFASISPEEYADKVFALSNVRAVIMTNDPFDDVERVTWQKGKETDGRFQPALRIDVLLNQWDDAAPQLRKQGYEVRGDLGDSDVRTVSRFLTDWVERISPRYMAVSLPPTFEFPEPGPRGRLIEQCVLPVAQQAGLPLAMMIGVRRQVNPALRVAGDGVGRANIEPIDRLCVQFPENRFLVTMLSRENQHELCVAARKQPNLLPFGCWWFLNNPGIIQDMTRMRLEMLGLSFIPQHSDARVMDQLIYKWAHSRAIIGEVLADKYADLLRAGWPPTEAEIRRDVADLSGGVFERFCGKP